MIRTFALLVPALALMACEPVEPKIHEQPEAPEVEQLAVYRAAIDSAIDEVALGLDETRVADFGELDGLDTDAVILAAIEETEAAGCEVAGIMGGVWAEEDNLFYGQAFAFNGLASAEMAGFYMTIDEDFGVYSGYWQDLAGGASVAEGNLGGLYNDEHSFLGRWTGDSSEGLMVGLWMPVNIYGGIYLGVWGSCS